MNQTLCKNSLVKLSPPSVPQACRHGIGVRTASSLTVHIDPYDSMDDGDLIELFWDGCYVASKILTASDIGTAIALRVPESFLQNGKARTYYRVMKVGNADHVDLPQTVGQAQPARRTAARPQRGGESRAGAALRGAFGAASRPDAAASGRRVADGHRALPEHGGPR